MERKSWKWFNSSAWKSRRHRESWADRRFGGELREGTGGDFRAERRNREAKRELKMFHVFQWAERDAISPRVSCVSTFRVDAPRAASSSRFQLAAALYEKVHWLEVSRHLRRCRQPFSVARISLTDTAARGVNSSRISGSTGNPERLVYLSDVAAHHQRLDPGPIQRF